MKKKSKKPSIRMLLARVERTHIEQFNGGPIKLPAPVAAFVRDFDHGEFPELKW